MNRLFSPITLRLLMAATFLVVACLLPAVVRADDPPPRPLTPARQFALPARILMVVSRPDDVGFIDPRSSAAPLLDAVKFLRPPTPFATTGTLNNTASVTANERDTYLWNNTDTESTAGWRFVYLPVVLR